MQSRRPYAAKHPADSAEAYRPWSQYPPLRIWVCGLITNSGRGGDGAGRKSCACSECWPCSVLSSGEPQRQTRSHLPPTRLAGSSSMINAYAPLSSFGLTYGRSPMGLAAGARGMRTGSPPLATVMAGDLDFYPRGEGIPHPALEFMAGGPTRGARVFGGVFCPPHSRPHYEPPVVATPPHAR